MAALVGRWKADSTFSVDDTRATGLGNQDILMEVFADTTYSQRDSSGLAFKGRSDGVYHLSADTLIVFPAAAQPDTFMVKLRFLGNYLELDHPADQRFLFFHKIKPPDSATQQVMLKDSLWRLEGRRVDPGIFQAEPQVRNFSYLRFSGDSMRSDTRVNGIPGADSGRLEKIGSNWTWKAAGGTRSFIADLVGEDSLRMWPLAQGRPDSGYRLYVRTGRLHGFDVDVRPLLGHMRSDSLVTRDGTLEYHYGRYYDWTFGEDHRVSVETNMTGVPLFQTWSLDSGFVFLQAPGAGAARFRLDTSGHAVTLTADSGQIFGEKSAFHQTKVDASLFRDKPLERFQSQSYFQAVVSGDTGDYFFHANSNGDRFEIASQDSGAADWVSLIVNKAQETLQSSQPGFLFALQGRNPRLGRFTCKSSPAIDMVIRLTGSADPLMAQGLVQGGCVIRSADSAFTDSTLDLEGIFRLKRKTTGNFASPLWSLP